MQAVSTPGIVLPDNAKFNSYGKTANSQRSSNPSHPKELLLHSESHRTMDYTAREDQSKGSLKHYIGVFDGKTGELQIIEARKMTVRGTVRSRRAADEALAQPKQHKAGPPNLNRFHDTPAYIHTPDHERPQERAWPNFRYQEGQEGHHVYNGERHLAGEWCGE